MGKPKIEDIELNIVYNMQSAMQVIIRDIERRMEYNREGLRYEAKQKFNRFMAEIKRIKMLEDSFDEDVFSVIKKLDDYTYWQQDASEMVTLLLLFIEKCDSRPHNKALLFKTLSEMEGNSVFSDNDINRLKIR